MHRSSATLVRHLMDSGVSKVVVGKNKNWKQNVNIGRQNNQAFVNIPFLQFINMLEYKLKLQGIELKTTQEHHTSKCSFLDNEKLKEKEANV